jgi:hypothetical protein
MVTANSVLQDLQSSAIAAEISKIITIGYWKVTPAHAPILTQFYLKSGTDFNEGLHLALMLRAGQMSEERRNGFKALLGSSKNAERAMLRAENASEATGISTQNFYRTHRKKIVRELSDIFAREKPWVLSSRQLQKISEDSGLSLEVRTKIEGNASSIYEFVVENMDRLRIRYDYSVTVDQVHAKTVTEYRCDRSLPSSDTLSIYICRTREQADEALKDPSTIGVELSEIDTQIWAAVRHEFTADLVIGRRQIKACGPPDQADDYVRFLFPKPAGIATGFMRVDVSTSYWSDTAQRHRTVRLLNYFCAEGVTINFKLVSKREVEITHAEFFVGFDGIQMFMAPTIDPRASGDGKGIELIVNSAPLIWPGSGIEFMWSYKNVT